MRSVALSNSTKGDMYTGSQAVSPRHESEQAQEKKNYKHLRNV